MNPYARSSALVIGVAVLAAMAATIVTRTVYDALHARPVPIGDREPLNPEMLHPYWEDGAPDWGFRNAETPPVTYLEYRGDGTVWVRWPDGNFIEVIPKP